MEKQVKITADLDLKRNKLKNAKIDANENKIENLTTESLAEGVLRQAMLSTPQENTILSESAVKQAIDVSVAEFNSMITSGLAEERQLRSQMDQDIINSLREEKTTRANADTTLQGNIDAEANARQLADTDLSNRITGVADNVSRETIARQNADNNLQQQIDGLSAAANGITDIVQSKTDLDNYDTSTLHSGDIIQVLIDSTHDNATAYYRWNGTSFDFVGTIAPSYTKEEAQATFVPLTRTVNGKALSTNITLNATDVGAMPNTTDISDLVSERQAVAINSGITSEDVVQIGTNENDINDLKNSMIDVQNDILNINSVVNNAVNIVSTKQDVLTSENAGANIRITGTGENLKISAQVEGYEVNWEDIVGDPRNNENLNTILETKQDNLIAGDGISIENNVITNTRVSAEWGNIVGDIEEQNDLMDVFDTKQDVLTAGNAIIIENSVISVDPSALEKSTYDKYNYRLLAGSTGLNTGLDLSNSIINVYANGIYQTEITNYTVETLDSISIIHFNSSFAENASIDIEVFSLNIVLKDIPIIALPNSQSTYTFVPNQTYQFMLSSSVNTVNFTLANPGNTRINNDILIHMYLGNANTVIDWGTDKFFNNETPTIESLGCYDVVYVWNNLLASWVCKVTLISTDPMDMYRNYRLGVNLRTFDNQIIIPEENEITCSLTIDNNVIVNNSPVILNNTVYFDFDHLFEGNSYPFTVNYNPVYPPSIYSSKSGSGNLNNTNSILMDNILYDYPNVNITVNVLGDNVIIPTGCVIITYPIDSGNTSIEAPLVNGIASFHYTEVDTLNSMYSRANISYSGDENYEQIINYSVELSGYDQIQLFAESNHTIDYTATPKIQTINVPIRTYLVDENNSMVLTGEPVYQNIYNRNDVYVTGNTLFVDSGGETYAEYTLIQNEPYTVETIFNGDMTYPSGSVNTVITAYNNDTIYITLQLGEAYRTIKAGNYVVQTDDYGVVEDPQTFIHTLNWIYEDNVPGIIFGVKAGYPAVSDENGVVNIEHDISEKDFSAGVFTDISVGEGLKLWSAFTSDNYQNNMLYLTNDNTYIYDNIMYIKDMNGIITTPIIDQSNNVIKLYNNMLMDSVGTFNIEGSFIQDNAVMDFAYAYMTTSNGNSIIIPENSIVKFIATLDTDNTVLFERNSKVNFNDSIITANRIIVRDNASVYVRNTNIEFIDLIINNSVVSFVNTLFNTTLNRVYATDSVVSLENCNFGNTIIDSTNWNSYIDNVNSIIFIDNIKVADRNNNMI